jgi:hypothetical protein
VALRSGLAGYGKIASIAESLYRNGSLCFLSTDGSVYPVGSTEFLGSPRAAGHETRAVDIEITNSGQGYYVLGRNLELFSYGDAPFLGSPAGSGALFEAADLEVSEAGSGYYILATDGTLLTYGTAVSYGAPSDSRSVRVVDLELTPSGEGYWILSDSGQVYTYGDAPFLGSSAVLDSERSIKIKSTGSGLGYYILSESSGIDTFGDAVDWGVLRGDLQAVDLALDPEGRGLLVLGSEGQVFGLGLSSDSGGFISAGISPSIVDFDWAVTQDVLAEPQSTWTGFTLLDSNKDIDGRVSIPIIASSPQAQELRLQLRVSSSKFELTGVTGQAAPTIWPLDEGWFELSLLVSPSMGTRVLGYIELVSYDSAEYDEIPWIELGVDGEALSRRAVRVFPEGEGQVTFLPGGLVGLPVVKPGAVLYDSSRLRYLGSEYARVADAGLSGDDFRLFRERMLPDRELVNDEIRTMFVDPSFDRVVVLFFKRLVEGLDALNTPLNIVRRDLE